MRRHKCFGCFGLAFALTACSASGEDDARQWIANRISVPFPATSLDLPSIVDTPPALYLAKSVVDPFSPGRIGQSRPTAGPVQDEASGRVHFSDATVEDLRAVGFLEVRGNYVMLVEGSSGFANVKAGDCLGNQQEEVVEIARKGIRLRKADGSEYWMPISRRGH